MTERADVIEVDDSLLSEAQKEVFERAFLEPDGVVEWRGERYYVTAMDQNYPEERRDDPIKVSFSLKRA